MPRLSRFLVLIPCTLVLAPPASAARSGPEVLFGRPVHRPPEPSADELAARRAAFERHLQERDLIEIGGHVAPRGPAGRGVTTPPGEAEAWSQPPHRQTIFLNFTGGTLSEGNIAAEMQAQCLPAAELDYPGFAGSERDALAIVQMVEQAVEPFGIRVAFGGDPPPKHLPYTMVMLGGHAELLGSAAGVGNKICVADCGDQWWRDTAFVFTEEGGNVYLHGNSAVQVLGRSWGLDFVKGSGFYMTPMLMQGTRAWADGCTELNYNFGPASCNSVHEEFCGPDSDAQNDVAELLAFFGPNSVDDVPPTVTLLSPQDGATLEPGDPLEIEVEVEDNFEGVGWRLMVPELGQESPAHHGEKSWTVTLPKGQYTIRVEAIDHDRNIGFDEATIYVGVEPGTETTGDPTTGTPTTSDGSDGSGNDGSGSDGSASGGSGGSGSDADTSEPATAGTDPPGEAGCNCASGPVSKDMPAGALALALLGLIRRRR